MNTKPNFTNHWWNSFNWLLAALALALTVPVREASGQAPVIQVYTGSAGCITDTSATLNGTLSHYSTGFVAVSVYFDWGTTTNYGNSLELQEEFDGYYSIDLYCDVSGLSPCTTYHFCASASGNFPPRNRLRR